MYNMQIRLLQKVFPFSSKLARGSKQLSWLVKKEHLFPKIKFSNAFISLVFVQNIPLPMKISTFSKMCREVLFIYIYNYIYIYITFQIDQIKDSGNNIYKEWVFKQNSFKNYNICSSSQTHICKLFVNLLYIYIHIYIYIMSYL